MADRPAEEQGTGVLRYVDAVTVRVPDLDSGLAFYRDGLGQRLLWRNDEIGQAGLATPESSTEIVLTTSYGYEPNWKVASVEDAVATFVAQGGRVVAEVRDIPIGKLAVVADPPFRERLSPPRQLQRYLHHRRERPGNGSVVGGRTRRRHRVVLPPRPGPGLRRRQDVTL